MAVADPAVRGGLPRRAEGFIMFLWFCEVDMDEKETHWLYRVIRWLV